MVLEHRPERRLHVLHVELLLAERRQRLRPVDRLREPRRLLQVEQAQLRDERGRLGREPLRNAGHAQLHDLDLPLERRVADPVEEAAALERVVQLARPVRGEDHVGTLLRLDRAELGDRDLEVRQHLEQERLELLVGAVDLVDQEHDRLLRLDRLQQRPPDQELRAEELRLVDRSRLGRPDVQQLPRVVPLVHGVRDVEALVALQADHARAECLRDRLRGLGLADARFALPAAAASRASARGRAPSRARGPGDTTLRRAPIRARRSRQTARSERSGKRDSRLTRAAVPDIESAMAAETLVPSSADEAVQLFGDGDGITVFAGGTILMPEIAAGRLKPTRALLLHRSGLDELRTDGDVVRIGAMVPVAALAEGRRAARALRGAGRPTSRCARPRRSAATSARSGGLGGQKGDLGAPLIALGARVRSDGKGGERTEPVEDFLAGDRTGRLVLEIEYDKPSGSWSAQTLRRRHAHSYAIANVAVCSNGDGLRVGVSGVGPVGRARPHRRAEPQRRGRPEGRRSRRRRRRHRRVPPQDAGRARPSRTRGSGELMTLTVNGIEHEITSPPLTALLHVLREELEIMSPKAGCQQGGCGTCTVLVDGEPRRSCLTAVATVDGCNDHDARGPRRGRERSRPCRPRSTTTTPRSAASARPG